MKPKDISVEYAHIYTNNRIGDEHKLSLKALEQVKQSHVDETLSLVVMVDDYSFPDPAFDYGSFTKWLSQNGHAPDLIFRESQLIPLCDEVLKLMSSVKQKSQIEDYIKAKKYPCSLFIASWYLLRLGCLTHEAFDSALVANKLINILPSSFKPFEDKALDIISDTRLVDTDKKIEHQYFEGRLIA